MVSTRESRIERIKELLKILLGPRWVWIIETSRTSRPVDVLPPGVNYEPREWLLMRNALTLPSLKNIWALEELVKRYAMWTTFSMLKYQDWSKK